MVADEGVVERDVSVPMAMMRKSGDDYGKGICR